MTATPEEPGDAQVLAEAAEHVSDSAGALAEQIAGLRADLAAERRRGKRNTLGLWFMGLGLLLDIALTISMIVIASDQYITAAEQAKTRVKVLCPLYTLLLSSVDPKARAAMPPAQQAVYDHTVKVIQDGYGNLGCSPAFTPSGTASSR